MDPKAITDPVSLPPEDAKPETVEIEKDPVKADTEAILGAVKEITKLMSDYIKEDQKMRKAGRF